MKRSLRGNFVLIIILAAVPYFVALSSTSLVSYSQTKRRLEQQIENRTKTLQLLIDSLLENSVRSYLRAKVETGEHIIERFQEEGVSISSKTGRLRLLQALATVRVGGDGYIYILDDTGRIIYHPDPSLIGVDLHDQVPVQEQLQKRSGYLEYSWKNSDEERERKKALYMSPIPGLDWIVSATSYRAQFVNMIDLEAVKEAVRSVNFGNSGYSYVVDRDGFFVAHPHFEGLRIRDLPAGAEYEDVLKGFFESRSGVSSYPWRRDMTMRMREKVVNFRYLPDFDWVIVTGLYKDDIGGSVRRILLLNILSALLVGAVLALIVIHVNRSVARTVQDLVHVLERNAAGELSSRVDPSGPRELSDLAVHINGFLSSFQESSRKLQQNLKDKEQLFQEIQHRVKNNLQLILSLLYLQEESASGEEAKQALSHFQHRIAGMAMVYEHLSSSSKPFEEDSVPIDSFLDEYIRRLLTSRSYRGKQIAYSIAPIILSRNRAIHLSLLVNELLLLLFQDEDGGEDRCELCIERREARFVLRLKSFRILFTPHRLARYELLEVLEQQLALLSLRTGDSGTQLILEFPLEDSYHG